MRRLPTASFDLPWDNPIVNIPGKEEGLRHCSHKSPTPESLQVRLAASANGGTVLPPQETGFPPFQICILPTEFAHQKVNKISRTQQELLLFVKHLAA